MNARVLKRWAPLTWAVVLLGSAVFLMAAASAAPALQSRDAQRVEVPSLDRQGGAPVLLPGYWFSTAAAANSARPALDPNHSVRPALDVNSASPALVTNSPRPALVTNGARPALVLLHGCGGAFGRGLQLAERYTELASRLADMGVQALVLDSLTPRGERELCTQRNGQRKVTQLQRRRDALGALQWLAAQPGVDGSRLGVLGWSNGGSTVLAATNLAHDEVARAAVKPSLAVAFYPGCVAERDRGYLPVAPLLMLLGEADDWTPAGPCKELAAAARGPTPPQWHSFEGAHHGFDGTAAVRFRTDVPNGAPGRGGVHVGGQALARSLAAQRLHEFLHAQWQLAPAVAPAAAPEAAALPQQPRTGH